MFAQLKKTRYLCGVNQLKQPQKSINYGKVQLFGERQKRC